MNLRRTSVVPGLLSAVLVLGSPTDSQAQSNSELTNQVIMEAAKAIDASREQREQRRAAEAAKEQQAQQQQLQQAERERLLKEKAEADRRKTVLAQIKQWPGLGGLQPPLKPGEFYAETENGCGIVVPVDRKKEITRLKYTQDGKMVKTADGSPVMETVSVEQWIRESVWTGNCAYGLAQGMGVVARRSEIATMSDYRREYVFGRVLGRSRSETTKRVTYSTDDMRIVSVPDWSDPYTPRFGALGSDEPATQLQYSENLNGYRPIGVYAVKMGCLGLTPKPRGCSYKDNYPAFVVRVIVHTNKEHPITDTLCPNPRSSEKCDVVWNKVAGPTIEKIKAVVAEVEARDAARKAELEQMHAMHVMTYRLNEATRQAENQQGIERRKAVAQAAEVEAQRDRAAAAEKAEKERIVAEEKAKKDREKAEAEFKKKITTLNAGQLFVFADELKSAGQSAQARQALRAFIERFPDHALAASAASTLTTLK